MSHLWCVFRAGEKTENEFRTIINHGELISILFWSVCIPLYDSIFILFVNFSTDYPECYADNIPLSCLRARVLGQKLSRLLLYIYRVFHWTCNPKFTKLEKRLYWINILQKFLEMGTMLPFTERNPLLEIS